MPSNKKRSTIVNPLTGRRIQVGGATYKRLMRSQRGKGGKQVAKTQRALDTISEFVRGSTMCPPSERCSRWRTRSHPVRTGRSCSLGNILSQAGQRPRTTATCWRRIESVLAPQRDTLVAFFRARLAPYFYNPTKYTTLKPQVPLSVTDLLDEAKAHLSLPPRLRKAYFTDDAFGDPVAIDIDRYLFIVLVEGLGERVFEYYLKTFEIRSELDLIPGRFDEWIMGDIDLMRQSADILARGRYGMFDFTTVIEMWIDPSKWANIISVVAAIDLSKARRMEAKLGLIPNPNS